MHFDELIAAQAGRFTRGQATVAGFSSFRIARRIERGEWRVVRGRVLALVAAPESADARDWEALLSAGPGAVLAGFSAARHHGMDRSTDVRASWCRDRVASTFRLACSCCVAASTGTTSSSART